MNRLANEQWKRGSTKKEQIEIDAKMVNFDLMPLVSKTLPIKCQKGVASFDLIHFLSSFISNSSSLALIYMGAYWSGYP